MASYLSQPKQFTQFKPQSSTYEWKTKIGIYKIVNTITGDMYIGSSVNLENRRREHLFYLRHSTHHSPYLQRVYDKYGESAFLFEVIEYLKFPINYKKELINEHLLCREYYYISSLKPSYNIVTVDEHHNIKYGKKQFIKNSQNYHSKGRTFSAEAQIKSAMTNRTRVRSVEETIKRSLSARKSTKVFFFGAYDLEGNLIKRFVSYKLAASELNVNPGSIRSNLKGRTMTVGLPSKQRVVFKNL